MIPENAHVEVIDEYPNVAAIRIRRRDVEYTCLATEVTYEQPVSTQAEREMTARLTPYAVAIKAGLSVDQLAKQFGKPVVAITNIWRAVKRRGMA